MSTQIEISDATYAKIMGALGPEDTAGSFIAKTVNSYLNAEIEPKVSAPQSLKFSGTHVPDLTFTKITNATINGTPISKNNWATLTYEILKHAKQSGLNLLSFNSLRIVEGKNEDNGFWFAEELGISMQGQSANDAWRAIVEIADKSSARIEVQFCWRDTPKAAHPGINSLLVFP